MSGGGNISSNTSASPPAQTLNIQPTPPGPLVSVLHTERKMRIFGVTENELRTLSIVNAAMTALLALGTGCFGFLLNLRVSLALTDKIPAETTLLLKYIEPGLFWFGIILYALGFVAWFMKGGFIATIKRESDPQLRQASPGWLRRVWAAIRS